MGRKLASALSDRESGLTFDAGSLVLADYLDRWLEDSVRDSVKQRTFENYAYVVRLHLAPTLGHLKLKAPESRSRAGAVPLQAQFGVVPRHGDLEDLASLYEEIPRSERVREAVEATAEDLKAEDS